MAGLVDSPNGLALCELSNTSQGSELGFAVEQLVGSGVDEACSLPWSKANAKRPCAERHGDRMRAAHRAHDRGPARFEIENEIETTIGQDAMAPAIAREAPKAVDDAQQRLGHG
jgi:hypothetical protein